MGCLSRCSRQGFRQRTFAHSSSACSITFSHQSQCCNGCHRALLLHLLLCTLCQHSAPGTHLLQQCPHLSQTLSILADCTCLPPVSVSLLASVHRLPCARLQDTPLVFALLSSPRCPRGTVFSGSGSAAAADCRPPRVFTVPLSPSAVSSTLNFADRSLPACTRHLSSVTL